jgi:succinate dehydrogenase hydrophobic anchor subunit
MGGVAALFAVAAVLFGLGTALGSPHLRSAAVWAFFSAIFVAFLPLMLLAVVLTYEKLFRGKREP